MTRSSLRMLFALLVAAMAASSASDTPELIWAVGGTVTFRSNNTKGNAAFWSFGNDPILAVAFRDPPRPIFSEDKFKTRFTVSERGRALSISQLRMEDAGTYSVTIDGKISTFTLLVYRELTEPTVTCESLNCSDGRCLLSLRCSVPGAGFGNVSYTWTGWGQRWEERPVVLTAVDKSSLDELEPLTCTAQNAVSSRSVTVTIPGLCPENSVDPPGPGVLSQSRVGFGIIAGIGAAVAVLLGFLMFFCKSQGWRKFHLSQSNSPNTATTGEFTTVYAEVGPSQQRIPNGIKAKPAAGESSSTIYSLVKRPEQLESATVTGLELV